VRLPPAGIPADRGAAVAALLRLIPVSGEIVRSARDRNTRPPLGALDALHLATALRAASELEGLGCCATTPTLRPPPATPACRLSVREGGRNRGRR
jgi:hypothetical protein